MRLPVIAVVLLLTIPLSAQTTRKTDGKPAQKKQLAEQASPAPKPSPEIRKLLDSMVGRWKVSGSILDEQWAPGGAEGSGFDTMRRGPGGFSLISDAEMNFGKMGPFAGHGVIFWDPAKQSYSGYWCDSWTPICDTVGLGKWEGEKLVFNSEMEMNGQKIPIRQTYTFSKEQFDWLMEAGDGKGAWRPQMRLKYVRSGPASPSSLRVQ